MAEAIAARKAKPKGKKLEREPSPVEVVYMFKSPQEKTGRDGNKYNVFHKTGPGDGAFTRDDLLDITGIGAKLHTAKLKNSKYTKKRRARENAIDEAEASTDLNGLIDKARRDIKKEYAAQCLKPLFTFAKLHTTDQPRLALWGFQDKKGDLVIGQRNDGAIWAISMLAASNGIARANHRARILAERLITQGISQEYKDELLKLTGKK